MCINNKNYISTKLIIRLTQISIHIIVYSFICESAGSAVPTHQWAEYKVICSPAFSLQLKWCFWWSLAFSFVMMKEVAPTTSWSCCENWIDRLVDLRASRTLSSSLLAPEPRLRSTPVSDISVTLISSVARCHICIYASLSFSGHSCDGVRWVWISNDLFTSLWLWQCGF